MKVWFLTAEIGSTQKLFFNPVSAGGAALSADQGDSQEFNKW